MQPQNPNIRPYPDISREAWRIIHESDDKTPVTLETAQKIVGNCAADALSEIRDGKYPLLDEEGYFAPLGLAQRRFYFNAKHKREKEKQMTEQIKKTRAEFVAEKIAEVKAKTGLDVVEKDLDFAKKTGGLNGLNAFEEAVAQVAFEKYKVETPPELQRSKDFAGYVANRQAVEAKKAADYRRRAGLSPA